ncbi:hypothetical protein [Burkholderia anthinoferrum]|uniref:Uncharacterized protein n=1 Tax=Burkholderia anthinoferrum TaxID=3090833 RepID=A0ABU5WNM4_9BURK|nr:hypothetical protein [Burkholderia anthinoferrum]MEB2504626.1 hypothetical protein [Burkholderia anthinoferrum]MEB2580582.1 hypothetical protein [Burkholderia anthinoferrum]
MRNVIKCQASSESESWSVEIFEGEALVASVHGLASAAHAREASDYLRSGLLTGWRLSCAPSGEEVDAAIAAMHEFEQGEALRSAGEDDDAADSPEQIERLRAREILMSAAFARAGRIAAMRVE